MYLTTEGQEKGEKWARKAIWGNVPCAQAGFASSAAPDTVRGVIESWTVSGAGNSRTVTVNVSYPRKSGWSTFSLQAVVGCY